MQLDNHTKITVYPPARQGSGSFDNGKITEIKPVDFPGGNSEAPRVGPLFYWAWASAKGDGVIGMHPHQAFEIISYVLDGEIGHTDSLKNNSRVSSGGAQVMQAGSGIYHQEEMYGEQTEFFQIWFEPYLRESIRKTPTYNQYLHEDFPSIADNGATRKEIIGNTAPVQLDADVRMQDIEIQPGKSYHFTVDAGNTIAAMTVSGKGRWVSDSDSVSREIQTRDFSVIQASQDSEVLVEADETQGLRLVVIEVPSRVDYPLYGQ